MSLATGPVDSALQSLLDRLENISGQFQELRDGVQQVIVIADASPEMALTRARKVLEYVIRDVYERRINEPPGTRPLENLLQRLVKDGFFPDRLDAYASTIRKLGNVGTHGFGEKVGLADVYQSLAQLMPILEWYFEFERPEAIEATVANSHQRSAERKPVAQPASTATHAPVVPKGLRAFDAQDADFFVELLPGARDKDGLPESIRFWKHRIEAADEATFMVAVVYGPSGCGKSSLVKAGLLPKLDREIVPVYVEATADGTEHRLLKGLRQRWQALGDTTELVAGIKHLREMGGKKTLIVLDQFEQWLHAHRNEQDTELAQALRQCDGQHVQCLILVRDDFWMALGRFMAEVQIELVQRQNMAAVDLFDSLHARSVLEMFGSSFGRIANELTDGQKSFLDQAVRGLAQDGRVIPVQLALFADMIKGKPWLPATLEEVGGTAGVGVNFLEETFSSTSATAERRYHARAARAVLRALLPELGTDIKGHMRSYKESLEASGYGLDASRFNDLVRILDSELRLITPTDPEGKDEACAAGSQQYQPEEKYYQLTHDYLVGSLRQWLNRKQRETRRGRSELRLAERSAAWAARPEKRQLPSLLEWLNIRWLTEKKSWTHEQARMMQEAARRHVFRALVAASVVAAIALGAREVAGRIEADSLVERLISADIVQVPSIVEKLTAYERWALPILRARERQAPEGSPQQLHLQLALLAAGDHQVQDWNKRLTEATPSQFPVVCTMIGPKRAEFVEPLWNAALDPFLPVARRFQAACALASYAPGDPRWKNIDGLVAEQLVNRHAWEYLVWREALRGAKSQLISALAAIYRDRHQTQQARTYAAETLADYASEDPPTLLDLLADAEQFEFQTLYDSLVRHREEAIRIAQEELAKTASDGAAEDTKERLAQRQANLAVALYRMGQFEAVWPLLKQSSDSRVRSYIIHWLGWRGAEPTQVGRRLEIETDVSTRRAMILSLADFPETRWPADYRKQTLEELERVFVGTADPGERAAAEWVIRQWGQNEWLAQAQSQNAERELREKRLAGILQDLKDRKGKVDPRWFVNSQAQTMVVIPGPVEFTMGAPGTETGRFADEPQHAQRIGRTFAIGATPVTIAQYRKYDTKYEFTERYAPVPACPAISITWYEAARYCNWLSKEEGIPAKELCYETNSKGEVIQLKKDYLSLTGYRLPTEAESEWATRAGSMTSRYYGEAETLLAEYGWYLRNSDEHGWPVGGKKPNDFGLFDMQGNVWCWCQERYHPHPQPQAGKASEDMEDKLTIDNAENRVLRGGAYNMLSAYLRSANRHDYAPTYHVNSAGFRVARTIRVE